MDDWDERAKAAGDVSRELLSLFAVLASQMGGYIAGRLRDGAW